MLFLTNVNEAERDRRNQFNFDIRRTRLRFQNSFLKKRALDWKRRLQIRLIYLSEIQ